MAWKSGGGGVLCPHTIAMISEQIRFLRSSTSIDFNCHFISFTRLLFKSVCKLNDHLIFMFLRNFFVFVFVFSYQNLSYFQSM